MRLSAIFVMHNQHEITESALDVAISNATDPDTEFVVLDNGSERPFEYVSDRVRIVRLAANIGVYPTFHHMMHEATGDVLAFFHNDLMVAEKGWDGRVLKEFMERPKLGLLGFIGSNEIDGAGGRGLGTTSNFLGNEYYHANPEKVWKGSDGSVHGKVSEGFSLAAVVDGCAMIFRREALNAIPFRTNFPLHHFYDRLLSCEVQERGYDVGVLGIGCDHISGQTANQEKTYHSAAEMWCKDHQLAPAQNENGTPNWDLTMYLDAEHKFLSEYRDIKHFIPRHV